jgi:hypothetical protein
MVGASTDSKETGGLEQKCLQIVTTELVFRISCVRMTSYLSKSRKGIDLIGLDVSEPTVPFQFLVQIHVQMSDTSENAFHF